MNVPILWARRHTVPPAASLAVTSAPRSRSRGEDWQASSPRRWRISQSCRSWTFPITSCRAPSRRNLGNLRNLTTLGLEFNGLWGPIPPELGDLAALQILALTGNRGLSGCIPPEMYEEVRGHREPGECRQ